MYGAIPKTIALGFHSTHERLNIAVRDAVSQELLFVDSLQGVGHWLRAYEFKYAVGTQARWYRP